MARGMWLVSLEDLGFPFTARADVHGAPAAGLALARPALARPALQGLGAGDSARAARPGAGLARRVVLVPAAFILAVFAHLDAQPHDVGGARVTQAWAHTVQLITHLRISAAWLSDPRACAQHAWHASTHARQH